MGRPSKRASKVRKGAEFAGASMRMALANPYKSAGGVYSWQLAQIYAARNDQMSGRFTTAARLAESMRTDDALMVAYTNRLAPLRCLKVQMKPASGAGGRSISREADALFGQEGVGLSQETISDVNGCLVNHGVAFTVNDHVLREDGSRTDFAVRYFPIEFVRWDETQQCFLARVDGLNEVPIVHGDGRWTVYRKHEYEPWKHGLVLAGGLVWARHAFAGRDWAKGSAAHGNAKVIGELPEGVSLQGPDGQLSQEAAAFVELLRAVASDDMPVGIRPSGAKTEYITNNSTAWQVFAELMNNAEKAAARLYLGTDGVLGSQGGAPGVDIESLFGVATTLVQGDIQAIERGVREGIIEPWCAMNFGDSSQAPRRSYLIPDADADAARAAMATRRTAFFADIAAARSNGFDVTQDYVNGLAGSHGVEAPLLKVAPVVAPPVPVAPLPAPTAEEIAEVVARRMPPAPAPVVVNTPPQLAPVADPSVEIAVAALDRKVETLAAKAPHVDPSVARLADEVRNAGAKVDRLAESTIRTVADVVEERVSRATELFRLELKAQSPKPEEVPFHIRNAAYLGDIKDMQARGLAIDNKFLRTLAKHHNVPPMSMKDA